MVDPAPSAPAPTDSATSAAGRGDRAESPDADALLGRHHAAPETSSQSYGVELRVQIARNLIVARGALGVTQDELSERSGISRATIAQIESGQADFRLSTLADLARALRVSPVLLLLGQADLESLLSFVHRPLVEPLLSRLTPTQIQQMQRLKDSGLQKNLVRAGRVGAEAAGAAGFRSVGAVVGAGIGSTLIPGLGTAVGTALGAKLVGRPHWHDEVEGGLGI